MNSHIKLEIANEVMVTKNFLAACKLAATKDDGKVEKEEQKQLDKISKAAIKFLKELEKIN